jgi:hypothetical protein
MANTVIQLKYSTATATPTSLNVAEPAYSYTSNIAYIGSPAGTGSIAIGGKFYIDQQGLIYNHANAAFLAANNATDTYVRNHANAAFDSANSAATLQSGINATQNTNITNAQNTGDAAFLSGNTAATLQTGINATQNTNITTVTNSVTAAFTTANNALPKAGGTITADLVIAGNLTVSGLTTYANTTSVQLGDNIITLNADIPTSLAPTENAGFEVNRGSAANVSLLWNETNDKWTATNDGTNYFVLADAAVNDTQNTNITTVTNTATAAFLAGNTAATLQSAINLTQNNSITAAFEVANTSTGVNLTQNTSIAAVFSLANGTALIANTDVTNVNITSADYGNAASVSAFKVAANGRIISANSTAIAIDAGAVTSGTLAVARGGTGVGTHTVNGVLLGQGTSAFQTASSSTEGHILTINNSGVPAFSHLQGGTF